jgi:hypothetical protein
MRVLQIRALLTATLNGTQIATERTRLSGAALDLLASATRLGPAYAPLLHTYASHIARLLARTNKLYISRAQDCLTSIARNTRLAALLPYLREAIEDKSGSMRRAAVEVTLAAVQGEHMAIDKADLERRYLPDIEHIVRKAAVDREVKVREAAKAVWQIYRKEWPERVNACVRGGPIT